MPRGVSDKVTFKQYEQHQPWLLPPSADELIPAKHLVRSVSATIDEMNLAPILSKYDKGGGASRFHPLMMLKVLVYGYMTKTYSSRMIAKALRENVMFMWLAGNQKPDFRTINAFRGSKLKHVMDEVFITTVKHLAEKGYVKLENYFIDGTKIESAANKYSFVWKRGIETNERKLDEKLRAFIKEADDSVTKENLEYGDCDLEEMGEQATFTAEDATKLAKILNEKLAALEESETEPEVRKTLKEGIKRLETDVVPRKKKYAEQRAILGNRNSYSKTDHDATFMRMKEDHMKNGQLKPGYNVQVGTENGFVLGYDIYANPTDTRTLKPHLENMRARLGRLPARVIADAGYGSEENYAYLEEHGVDAIVKDGTFHRAGKRSWSRNPFNVDTWKYDHERDAYTCPAGRRLAFAREAQKKTEGGYAQTLRYYVCESCEGCPLREQCTRSQGNRIIQRNEELRRLREKAHSRLLSEDGKALRKRRAVEVETVFGQTKANQSFRRFHLRGMSKVSVEWGLLMIGYNIKRARLQP